MSQYRIENQIVQHIALHSFVKAVEGIEPIDPEDIEKAIALMKDVYRNMAGFKSDEAAIAADKLALRYHGARASEQTVLGRSIINTAKQLREIISK